MSNRNLIYGMIILAVLCFSVMLGGCKNNKAESATPSEQESSSAVSSEESKAESEDERPIPTGADENEIFLFGDANDDFSVDANDALLILRASVGVANVDENLFPLADIDKDEALTANDALEVLRYSVDLSDNDRIGNPYSNGKTQMILDLEDPVPPENFDGHVLTFDSMGGTPVRTQLVNNGCVTNMPLDPKKDGCVFDGWYENEDDFYRFGFGSELEKDTTLYARWADVNFYLHSDDFAVIIPVDGEGARVRLTLATPEDAPDGIEVRYGTKDHFDKKAVLLDNALAENGDDIKGDGVYSGYVTLYEPDTFIYFFAELGSEKSNYAKIQTIAGLAEGEVDSITIINDELSKLEDSPEYADYSKEERLNAGLKIIEKYSEEGIITSYKVTDELVAFSIKSGAAGVFCYGDDWLNIH